jgi:hypothetical protein
VSWADYAPLVTVVDCWVPMACGPNVDQAEPLSGSVRFGHWALESGDRGHPTRAPSSMVRPGLSRGPVMVRAACQELSLDLR